MKKCYLLCFLLVLFIGCRQSSEVNNKEEKQKPVPMLNEFTKTVEGIPFKMILVKAVKKTTLGVGTKNNERIVTLSPYYIAETEVTQELYEKVIGMNPSYFQGSEETKKVQDGEIQTKRPVEMVNWYEAAFFCNKLTEKIIGETECVYKFKDVKGNNGQIIEAEVAYDFSKKGFRLPTEAEWEYAAKGGDVNIVYAGGDLHVGEPEDKEHTLLKTLAWYNKNSDNRTHEVAKKVPNAYGLFDMSGNVREWCHDWYARPILSNVERDPQGPVIARSYRSMKGGGFGVGGYLDCTVTSRNATLPKQHENDRGFRIVCRLYE